MSMTVYVDNTNLIELFRLQSAIDDAYIDDAIVTLTIEDATGTEVSGETWPITLSFVSGSDGDYTGIINYQVGFDTDGAYTAVIDADAGVGRQGHWELPLIARTREY